jgi:cell division protein DivIC
LCQANLFAGRMEIEVRFDRVSIMAIQKKKVAGRSKSRKTNSAWRYHKKSMMLISMILVLLVGVLAVNAVSLRSRNAQYKKQEAELEAQIKEEKKRAKEVEAYEAYVKTDDYVKEIAEEKLDHFQAGKIVTIRKRSSGKFLGLFACSNIIYIRTRRTSP